MKKIIFSLVVVLLQTIAGQAFAASSKYEVVQVQGQNLVLIPVETAQQITDVLASTDSESTKIKQIQSIVAELGQLVSGEETFCSVAGEVYQTVNKKSDKMAAQCEERMTENEDMLGELLEDATTVEQVRDMYSRILALMITFSM